MSVGGGNKILSEIPMPVARVAPWFTAVDSQDFCKFVRRTSYDASAADSPRPIDRNKVAELAADFHQRAGTLTEDVAVALHCYGVGSLSLGVSHQPNFLANLNVAMQPVVMNDLANRIGGTCCQIFALVDYDVASDKRYRHAIFPSPLLGNGYASLSIRRPPDAAN